MQGNNIGDTAIVGQGVIFEGVLASPPEKTDAIKAAFYKQNNKWDKYVAKWKPVDLPLKAMIDSAIRLGVQTDVYTFIDSDAVDAVDLWLRKRGISVGVMYYESIHDLAYDLRFQHSIKTIYVETQEQASIIGIRSHTVDPKKAWIS
jgi:hypothetical protein